jgi:hypothetical protein
LTIDKILLIAAVSFTVLFTNTVNAQATQEPLRGVPKLSEDQIILCVTDYKHEAYRGQLSCIVSDDGLDNPVLRKLENKAESLKNTFELGLVD